MVCEMDKTIRVRKMNEIPPDDDLAWWLTQSPEKRLDAVEILRRQFYGDTERIQRVARIIKQA